MAAAQRQQSILAFVSNAGQKRKGNAGVAPVPKKRQRKVSGGGVEQAFLDFGPSLAPKTCAQCGMLYSCGVEEDEAVHATFHKRFLRALTVPKWKTETVVDVPNDKRLYGCVLCISVDSGAAQKSKAKDVLELVDRELNMAQQARGIPWEDVPQAKLYLMLSDKRRLLAVLVAQPQRKAYTALEEGSGAVDSAGHLQCSQEARDADVAVTKLWVHADSRRRGLAGRLLDVMRRDFVYGGVVERGRVAFSQPTPDGRALARAYVGKGYLLCK